MPPEPIKRAVRRQKVDSELDPPCRRGYHRAVDANATLASALAAYRAGRPAEARRAAEELWRGAGDARAAGLLALLELDARRFAQALAWNDRARAASPADLRYVRQGARIAALAGDPLGAFDRLAALLAAAPRTADAWADFAAAARASRREREAIAFCSRAFAADPSAQAILLALLSLVSDAPVDRALPDETPATDRVPISVVTCSNDEARFAAMAASYDRALMEWPHEIVRIADARSLAEGYTRGLERATADVVIFSHDDVEILPADFGHRLARRLAACDLLGIAGATRATAPAWPSAGWPHLHGCVIYPEGGEYHVTVYSRTVPIAHGMRVMDGVFLAMRRSVARAIGWDAEACEGFHGYDIDFTLRAAKGGRRLAVATDLGVVHRSYGSFDDRWRAAARKLAARHPELGGERAKDTGFVARAVPDAAHAMALVDNWATPML